MNCSHIYNCLSIGGKKIDRFARVTRKKNSPIRNQLTFSFALFDRNSFLSGKNNDTGEVRTYAI